MDDDGLISARRCLEAMAGADRPTRLALWKAAKKFAAKGRQDREAAIGSPALPHARCAGGSCARDCEW